MFRYWPNAMTIAFALVFSWATITSAQNDALPTPLNTDAAKASYGLGFQSGNQFVSSGLEIDVDAYIAGLKDALAKAEPRLAEKDVRAALESVQAAAQAKFKAQQKPLSDKNKKDGAAFIAKYKQVKGVKSLPGGILYKVLKAGTGDSPGATDVVKVHYRGRLTGGKEFDSSYKRNEPAVFPLNRVIPGWTASVQKMKVGGKWQVVIPSEMAYGANGSPPVIGPDAVLVFDIELLEIVEKGAAQ